MHLHYSCNFYGFLFSKRTFLIPVGEKAGFFYDRFIFNGPSIINYPIVLVQYYGQYT